MTYSDTATVRQWAGLWPAKQGTWKDILKYE